MIITLNSLQKNPTLLLIMKHFTFRHPQWFTIQIRPCSDMVVASFLSDPITAVLNALEMY